MPRMRVRLRSIAMVLAILLSVGRSTTARGQASPIYHGVFASNVVAVSWSGLCLITGSTNYTVTQGTTTLSLDQTAVCGAHKFTFQGTLQVDFPPVTPDATISFPDSLQQINWSPGLQISATLDGQWQLSATVSGNKLELINNLAVTGDGDCPGVQLPPYGPGLSDQSYPVMLTESCSTTNLAFPAVVGTDLIYGVGASANVYVYAPSNATPDTQFISFLSISAEAIYLVPTAAWIVVDTNKVHFDIGSISPVTQTVSIRNTGTANLNFSVGTNVSSGGNWLSVSPSQGTLTPNQATNLSISVDVTSLAPDQVTNTGQILISGNSSNSPQSIPVETVSTNVDLAVLSLAWNATTDSGLDLVYANLGGPLAVGTTAKLFWANGTNLASAISPIWTTNIPAGFTGMSSNHLAEASFYFPPNNATYLVLALDPNNLITESNKTNNVMALRNTFRHVVLVMMENRSFDHFLGWLPGADGRQTGTYTNASGQAWTNYHLTYFQGCGCDDPDHSYIGGRTSLNTNTHACDGWLLANPKDTYSIGYYLPGDLAFFSQIAPDWVVCDRYFAAILAETQPNRIYQHAAQTDCLTNRTTFGLTMPTIWDSLLSSNISARYYYDGSTFAQTPLFLWGKKYLSIEYGTSQFYTDCASGDLPSVSFVDPELTSATIFAAAQDFGLAPAGVDTGGNDDHPHADIRNGELFLSRIYNAIVSSPQWLSTVLIINFDEWGGFYDHVVPPVVPFDQIPTNDVNAYAAVSLNRSDPTYGSRGFRVPCIVISPWSHTNTVNHATFDHTSVLKLIEDRWGLPSLTARDLNAIDLTNVMDFAHPDFAASPALLPNVPSGSPFGGFCQSIQIATQSDGKLAATWDSTCLKVILQTAPELDGPWTDQPNLLTPPYVFTPVGGLGSTLLIRFKVLGSGYVTPSL